ncbi:MAG TPA: S-layer homology domain-containing protein [Chondromyces sp.]|nr:S-layer homology domain-containing protein [Chondromyces sp.]
MKKVCILLLSLLIFITAVPFQRVEAAAEPFKDIQSNNRFYEPVWSLVAKRVLIPESYYPAVVAPNKSVTRADAAYMISAMLGLELESNHPGFRDVTKAHPYYEPIAALAERGIISGYTDGTIRPNEILTRAQMAKMMSLSFKYTIRENATIPFKDVAKGNWAVPYIDALVRSGVTTGTTATTFTPDAKLTRQQMTLFLYRAYKAKPVSQYNDGEIFNVIREVQNKADMVVGYYKTVSPKRPDFSKVRGELLPYAEPAVVDGFMKYYYQYSCNDCDWIMYYPVYDTGLPYDIMERSNQRIKVKVRYPGGMDSPFSAVWTLINVNGKWKIKDLIEYSIDKDPFNLTVEQAKHYLKHEIESSAMWADSREYVVSIEYKGKSNNGYYKFDIETNEDFRSVEIDPFDASFH